MPIRKTEFPIIKGVNETYIALRLTDGYVNSSTLCEVCDKNLDDQYYNELEKKCYHTVERLQLAYSRLIIVRTTSSKVSRIIGYFHIQKQERVIM